MKYAAAVLLLCCCGLMQAEDNYQSLLEGHDPVWYDSDSDSLRRARIEKPDQSSNSLPSNDWSFSFGQFLFYLVYALIIAVIVFIIIQFIRHFSESAGITREVPQQASNVQAVRITDLPFQTDANIEDPQAALEQAWRSRQWQELVIYAFIVLLTELHKAQLIQLRPGKTNRRYLQDMRKAPRQLREILQLSMQLFERSFFGHQAVSDEQAQQLYSAVRNASQLIAGNGGTHAPR